MHLPLGFATGLTQGGPKLLPARVVVKNFLALVFPVHEVVDRSGILNASALRSELRRTGSLRGTDHEY